MIKVHADTIALLLMLGDDFSEREANFALREAGLDFNAFSYMLLQGYLSVSRRVPAAGSDDYRYYWRVNDKGKELLK